MNIYKDYYKNLIYKLPESKILLRIALLNAPIKEDILRIRNIYGSPKE